jgi:hypothetical protein
VKAADANRRQQRESRQHIAKVSVPLCGRIVPNEASS